MSVLMSQACRKAYNTLYCSYLVDLLVREYSSYCSYYYTVTIWKSMDVLLLLSAE